MFMWDWIKEIWKKEWPIVKTAPYSFAICFIVGIIVGTTGVLLLYDHFVLPDKDAQITLLQQEKDSLHSALQRALTDEQKQTYSTNTKDMKQDIRTLLESISPLILDRIDAGHEKIPVLISMLKQIKLNDLSEHPDFDNFLTFDKCGGSVRGAGKDAMYKGWVDEIGETGEKRRYYLYPKDALIK